MPRRSVRFSPARALLLCALAIPALSLKAQDWDAATQAVGWARQDKDDSFAFYDPATKLIHNWMRDGGDLRTVSLAKLEDPPSRWVLDPRGNAWVVAGTRLFQVLTDGRLGRDFRLPAQVDSVCWDTEGFVLSFKTLAPFLEKRRYTDGDVVWTFGKKPDGKESMTPMNLHPMLMDDHGQVLLGNGRDLNLLIINADNGKQEGATTFTWNGAPAPALAGGGTDRGPLVLWSGKRVAFAALRATDLPEAARGTLQDQVLARMDLNTSTVTFLPTGLNSQFLMVGVLDSNAVFVNPKGGLMLVPVK